MNELVGRIVQMEHAKGLPLPSYARESDTGMDIPMALPEGETWIIPPHSGLDVPTGLIVRPPAGYYFRVVGKGSSGKKGLGFTLEIVDEGYTGEVILHPFNASNKPVELVRGKAIAQLELVKRNFCRWEEISETEVEETNRGTGRMDSTKTGI